MPLAPQIAPDGATLIHADGAVLLAEDGDPCCCEPEGSCCGVIRMGCDPTNPNDTICCAMGRSYRVTLSGQVSTQHGYPRHFNRLRNAELQELVGATTTVYVNVTALVTCSGDSQVLSEITGEVRLERNHIAGSRLVQDCEVDGELRFENTSYSFRYVDADVLQVLGTAMLMGYTDSASLLLWMVQWNGLPTLFTPGISLPCTGSISFTPDPDGGCAPLNPSSIAWQGSNACQRRTVSYNRAFPIDGFLQCDQACLQTVAVETSSGQMTIDIVTLEPCTTDPCSEGLMGVQPVRFGQGDAASGGVLASSGGCAGCGDEGDGL